MTVDTKEQPTTRQTAGAQESAQQAAAAAGHHRPRVLILGGGVAGLTAAYELRRRVRDQADLTLISESEYFVLGPSLIWVPLGQRPLTFPLVPALQRRGIRFVHARVDHIDPEQQVVRARDQELSYDYLLIATGPRADGVAIPGVGGEFNATESLWTEQSAMEAAHSLERFLQAPGPAVVGLAPGAQYLNAAYEIVLLLDYALRRRGKRAQASLTFVTFEPYLGHLDSSIPQARRVLARLFAQRGITAITGTAIERVDRAGVHLQDGRIVSTAFTVVLPPFSGVTGIWKSAGLTDERGFVPVDARYRHVRYPQIYAAGVAAHLATRPARLPRTGYLAAAMARTAAQDVAVAITGHGRVAPALPRLLDLRLLDGGDAGVLLVRADMRRPVGLALPLPGPLAHHAKRLLARYLIWKLRTGLTRLP